MKTHFHIILAMVLAMAGASTTVVAQDSPANQFGGTWEMTIFLDGMEPFVEIATINKDGQMVNVGPAGVSAGSWRRVQGRLYDQTLTGFIRPDPNDLSFMVRATVNATVELSANGQQFTGPGRTSLSLMDGTPLFTVEGAVIGNRLPIEGY